MQENLAAEFIEKGCKSKKEVAIAVQVYLELSEVKRLWDIEVHYHNGLEKLYFTARKKRNEELSIFVPIAASESLSFADMQNLFQLKTGAQKIYIAIVHSDSTSVIYEIIEGLGEPLSLLAKASKDRASKLDFDLNKNRKLIEQAALYNIPITLPKKSKVDLPGPSGVKK